MKHLRSLKLIAWLAVPVLAALVTYLVATGSLRRAWAVLTKGDPVLEAPTALDFGVLEQGQLGVARFTISNRGGGELILDEIENLCACSGLEQENDGEFTRLETLRLQGGERADLAVRLNVGGMKIGEPYRSAIKFRTNDPTRPSARLELVVAKVTGGVFTVPGTIVFGNVPLQGTARQILEIRDLASVPRKLKEVVSRQPERLAVRVLPAETAGEGDGPGVLLARVEVILSTNEPGPVDGVIAIHLDDPSRPPDSVAVTGYVTPPVEITPSSVVLPRASGSGQLNWAECLCRSTEGKPVTLTVKDAPPGVAVEILPAGDDPSQRKLRIEWKPSASASAGEVVTRCRVNARVGDVDHVITIPLRLRR